MVGGCGPHWKDTTSGEIGFLDSWLILANIAKALGAGQLRTWPRTCVCLFVSSYALTLMQEDNDCIMVARGTGSKSQRVKSM